MLSVLPQVNLVACLFNNYGIFSMTLYRVYWFDYNYLQGSPPLSRNAPPVAGVVSWARQLLRRIEEPMQSFKSNSAILQSNVSSLQQYFTL